MCGFAREGPAPIAPAPEGRISRCGRGCEPSLPLIVHLGAVP